MTGSKPVRLQSGRRAHSRACAGCVAGWAGDGAACFAGAVEASCCDGAAGSSGASDRLLNQVIDEHHQGDRRRSQKAPTISAWFVPDQPARRPRHCRSRTSVRPFPRVGHHRFRCGRDRLRLRSSSRSRWCKSALAGKPSLPPQDFAGAGAGFASGQRCFRATVSLASRAARSRSPTDEVWMNSSSLSAIRSNPIFNPLVEADALAVNRSFRWRQSIATLCRRAQSRSALRMLGGGLSSSCSTRVRTRRRRVNGPSP